MFPMENKRRICAEVRRFMQSQDLLSTFWNYFQFQVIGKCPKIGEQVAKCFSMLLILLVFSMKNKPSFCSGSCDEHPIP